MEILIYIIVFGLYLFFFGNIRKNPVFTVYLLFYFGGACTAFYLWNFTEYYSTESKYINQLSVYAIIYHIFFLVIMLYPLKTYETKIRVSTLPDIDYRILKPIFYCVIIVSFIILYASIKDAQLKSGMDVTQIRASLGKGEIDNFVKNGTLLAYIVVIPAFFSIIVSFLFFYALCKFPKKKIMLTFIFLSGLIYPISTLQNAGRGYIFYYLFYNFIIYLLIKRQLSRQSMSYLKILFSIVFLLLTSIFMYITWMRFGDTKEGIDSVINSILDYYGQSYINFSNMFIDHGSGIDADLFSIFTGERGSQLRLASIYSSDVKLNVFSSYVGSFVFNFGIFKALIPLSLYTCLFYFIRKLKPNNLLFYFYVFLVYDFLFSGYFYHSKIITRGVGVSILLLIIVHLRYVLKQKY